MVLRTRLQAAFDRFVRPFEGPFELFVAGTRVVEGFHTLSEFYPLISGAILSVWLVICILLGMLFAIPIFIRGSDEPLTLRLSNGNPASEPKKRPQRIPREMGYFRHLLATVEESRAGDRVLLSGWPGANLRRPPGNIVSSFADICARKQLKPQYTFNFTEEQFAQVKAEAFATYLQDYAFAEVRFVILSHQMRAKRGLPKRSRFSIVVLPQQRVAYAHHRSDTGDFAIAMRYDGELFEIHQQILDELSFLTISAEDALKRCRDNNCADVLSLTTQEPLPIPIETLP